MVDKLDLIAVTFKFVTGQKSVDSFLIACRTFENENGLIVKFVESDKIAGKLYFNNEDEDTNN